LSAEGLKLYWLPQILCYFAETREFGVLDRIANALGAQQAISALYDAIRVYRSNCVKQPPDEECPVIRVKDSEISPAQLLEKAEYELDKLSEMLLDPAREEEALRLARAAALLALGKRCKPGEEG